MYKDLTTISTSAVNLNAIKQSIKNILLTRRGSVPGKPYFGSDIYNIIFQQLDHLTISIAKNYIEEALDNFENRINVKDIDIKKDEAFNKVVIDIYFSYNSGQSEEKSSTSISINL